MTRLSRIEPNGRIALELTPDIRSVDALPDLPLENGDRISVPPRPGFVTVAGAVVNSNAFVWKQGRTVGDYLRLAGADEAADTVEHVHPARRRHRQQRRSNGAASSVAAASSRRCCSRATRSSCPNQLDFETWGRALVRNLKDFAQIISGFGIGIAAIHSLNN